MLNSIDNIELDNFDKNIFKVNFVVILFYSQVFLTVQSFSNLKNVLFQLRAHQSKLKSLLTTSRNNLFKEVYVAVEIAINLFK